MAGITYAVAACRRRWFDHRSGAPPRLPPLFALEPRPATQTVSISDTLSGTTIYYTLNGTVPTTSSNAYTKAVTVGSTATLQAIAVKSGLS